MQGFKLSPANLVRTIVGLSALVALAALLWIAPVPKPERGTAERSAPVLTVYKSPSCPCCVKWVEHMQAQGFAVEVHNTEDLAAVRQHAGVPDRLASCHTAMVDGYVLEGHVPAADVRRLLRERPPGKGLAVPGMPIGSPGMEYGDHREPYEVLLFGAGAPKVYARHGQSE